MPDNLVSLSISNKIAAVGLNRPDKRNAFTLEMYQQFVDVVRRCRSADDVNVLVISGQGRDFCSGNDLSDFAGRPAWDPEELADRARTASTEIVHQLMECEKPIVAYVHGNAVGFGATLLLHCDVIIADSEAKFIFPFVDLALVPEAGATFLMPKVVGYLNAFDILTRGRPVGADEALRLKLITQVASGSQGSDAAIEIATRLAAKPKDALFQTKRLLKGDLNPLSAQVAMEFRELARRLSAPDARTILQQLTRKS